METAERRGIFCSGYHANQATLAPIGYLTGAEWDWTKVYSDYAEMIHTGKTTPARDTETICQIYRRISGGDRVRLGPGLATPVLVVRFWCGVNRGGKSFPNLRPFLEKPLLTSQGKDRSMLRIWICCLGVKASRTLF